MKPVSLTISVFVWVISSQIQLFIEAIGNAKAFYNVYLFKLTVKASRHKQHSSETKINVYTEQPAEHGGFKLTPTLF